MGHSTVNSKLDIITRVRGEVMGSRVPTGENLFLAWGYPTAIVLLTNRVHPADDGSVSRLRALISNIVAGSIRY